MPAGHARPHGAQPVSYTHLDVYKRQKLDGTAKGGAVISIKAKLGLPVRFVGVGEGMDDLMPVSYTHLDVYKRQAAACAWPRRGASPAP